MPNSPRYTIAKLIADALNALTRGIIQGASSIEYHIAEFHCKLEAKAHRAAITADGYAIKVAEDVHDKLIATHHATMQEAHEMYAEACAEATRIIAKAKAERAMLVELAADGCDEVRTALRKARDWHDA